MRVSSLRGGCFFLTKQSYDYVGDCFAAKNKSVARNDEKMNIKKFLLKQNQVEVKREAMFLNPK